MTWSADWTDSTTWPPPGYSPPQLSSLVSMRFDGWPCFYEGVELVAEDDEHGGYNLQARARGLTWIVGVPSRAKARAMFASLVGGDHRGWIEYGHGGPADPAIFTAGPGPASLGAYAWVADNGLHWWFDAADDRAAMVEARRQCTARFDRMHVYGMSFDVYRTGTEDGGRGYPIGSLELRIDGPLRVTAEPRRGRDE